MPTEDQYLVLTGKVANSGCWLIQHRALQLLSEFRPDRKVLDVKYAWEPFDQATLEECNRSRALILMGGPGIQEGALMRERIYRLVPNLDDIKVPIIMMGVGYKGAIGSWQETNDYEFDKPSFELLKRINESGYESSVRDYHTMNVLLSKGLKNFTMTGCPALYDVRSIGKPIRKPEDIKKIGFSIGVSHLGSRSMLQMEQKVILALREEFPNAELTAHMHQTVDRSVPLQNEMILWLERMGIPWTDISSSDAKLIETYKDVDMHVGYRVHAHIFACSVSIPSVLVTEDGRGVALRNVIGGMIHDGYHGRHRGLWWHLRKKLPGADSFIANENLPEDVVNNIRCDLDNGMGHFSQPRVNIDLHFEQMKKFIAQLP